MIRATRQLAGTVLGAVGHPDLVEQRLGSQPGGLLVAAAVAQRQEHVVQRVE
jgi:hypothetical protein